MNCRRFRLLTSLRLDSELSGFEVVLLGAHASSCAPCRAFAEEAEAITGHIRAADSAYAVAASSASHSLM